MVRLKKYLGQHLLVSPGILRKIVDTLELEEDDRVVEIGPGTGNLTRELLKTPLGELIALEKDREMAKALRDIQDSRLRVIEGDATQTELCDLGEDLKVCGNLPYNVASLIIERVVLSHKCITLGVFMLQKEVALKLTGKEPGGWLWAFLNIFYETHYIMSVPARFFVPKPKVSSGLIKLKRKDTAEGGGYDLKNLKDFLINLFSHRRKMLKSRVDEEALLSAGIEPTKRVHQLSLEEILRLYNFYGVSR